MMTQQSNQDWLDALNSEIIAEYAGSFAEMDDAYPDGYAAAMCREMCKLTVTYLAQRGMLQGGWMPIESAPRDEFIDTFGYFVEKGSKEKLPMRYADDYISANTVYPIMTTHFERDDGTTGSYYRTHWMPLPAAPKMEDIK